ncbi:MAG: hypothetical protein AB7P37_15335 [Ramlibacter sp.]
MSMQAALDAMQAALDALRTGRTGVQAFSTQVRGQTEQLGLPERYSEVLNDLLDRLESSALFSEESCSFSQSGLLDNLQLWIDKARAQLEKA